MKYISISFILFYILILLLHPWSLRGDFGQLTDRYFIILSFINIFFILVKFKKINIFYIVSYVCISSCYILLQSSYSEYMTFSYMFRFNSIKLFFPRTVHSYIHILWVLSAISIFFNTVLIICQSLKKQ
jgi:hypothetical protein